MLLPGTKIKILLLLKRILQGNIITGDILYGAYNKGEILLSEKYYKRKL